MRLGQVIDRLMKHFDEDQTEFAKRIGATGQTMVSRMKKPGDWEQHWQIFLTVLKLCKKLDIDPYAPTTEPPARALIQSLASEVGNAAIDKKVSSPKPDRARGRKK